MDFSAKNVFFVNAHQKCALLILDIIEYRRYELFGGIPKILLEYAQDSPLFINDIVYFHFSNFFWRDRRRAKAFTDFLDEISEDMFFLIAFPGSDVVYKEQTKVGSISLYKEYLEHSWNIKDGNTCINDTN